MRWHIVIGGDGMIGRGLFQELTRRGKYVIKTSRRGVKDTHTMPFDLAAPSKLLESPLLASRLASGPPIVFLAAGVTGLAACDQDPTGTAFINVEQTVELTRELLAKDSFVVFPSSNAVFGSDQRVLNESNIPDPITEYGRQKHCAEQALLELARFRRTGAGVAVVRLTKVLSADLPLINAWLQSLRRGAEIDAFEDYLMSPISLPYCVQGLINLADARTTGIYHLSGMEDISYFNFARILASRWIGAISRVRGTSAPEQSGTIRVSARHFKALSMDVTSAISGLMPQRITDVVEDIVAQAAATA